MFVTMSPTARSSAPALFSCVTFVLTLGCESYSAHFGEEKIDPNTLDDPAATLPAPQTGLCSIGITCGEAIEDEPKIDCKLALSERDGKNYEGLVAIERRGRSSLFYDKPNYAFELRNADGSNNPADLMAMGADEDWILDGSWVDRSFIRNQLVSDLFASFDASRFSPEGRYCELFLNQDYRGIYRLVERIKREASRIDLPVDEGNGETFVLQQDDDGALRFNVGLEDNWDTIYPKEPTVDQREGIQRFLNDLETALDRRSDDPATGIWSLLDRGNVIDWIIIQELSRNVDAYKLSLYLYRSKGNKAHLVPWDFDLSMGQPIVSRNAPEPRGGHESAGWGLERTAFIEDIIAVPGVAKAVAERFRALRRSVLATDQVLAQVDAYAGLLDDAVDENFARWPLDRVRFEHLYPPYSLYEVESYAEEIATLKNWLQERLTWMDDNIDTFEAGSR